MNESFLRSLRCPYCRSGFEVLQRLPADGDVIDHGVIACACYEYPIVDGIVVLRQMSGLSDTHDIAVQHLRLGDVDAARSHLLRTGSMVRPSVSAPLRSARRGLEPLARAARRVTMRLGNVRAGEKGAPDAGDDFRAELDRLRPGGFATYLFHRYSNPSFVASVPLMSLLESVERSRADGTAPMVLDLGCGLGHSTAMMHSFFPNMTYVAAEPDYVNLHLLRRYFVPDAMCVCVDAELPLPFGDHQFDAVFCLDAFHYIRSKWALLRELERVVDDRGVWMFAHLHNASASNMSPGIPLVASQYRRLFGSLQVVMLDEADVLGTFMKEQVLDLSSPPDPARLERAAAFCIVGSRHTLVGGRHHLGERITATTSGGRIGFNPIYRVVGHGATTRLELEWPDAQLELESSAIRSYLPQRVEIAAAVAAGIAAGDIPGEHLGTVTTLLRQFVLVHLAPGYERWWEAPANTGETSRVSQDADGAITAEQL